MYTPEAVSKAISEQYNIHINLPNWGSSKKPNQNETIENVKKSQDNNKLLLAGGILVFMVVVLFFIKKK